MKERGAFFIRARVERAGPAPETSRTAVVTGKLPSTAVACDFYLKQKTVKIAPRTPAFQRDHEQAIQEDNGGDRREDPGLFPRRLRRRLFLAEPRARAGRDHPHPQRPRRMARAAVRSRRLPRSLFQRRYRYRGQPRARF